ncbi:MAG: hypothetical protein ABSH20_30945, partial [Tepidisphaeraceae bacterium]
MNPEFPDMPRARPLPFAERNDDTAARAHGSSAWIWIVLFVGAVGFAVWKFYPNIRQVLAGASTTQPAAAPACGRTVPVL